MDEPQVLTTLLQMPEFPFMTKYFSYSCVSCFITLLLSAGQVSALVFLCCEYATKAMEAQMSSQHFQHTISFPLRDIMGWSDYIVVLSLTSQEFFMGFFQ